MSQLTEPFGSQNKNMESNWISVSTPPLDGELVIVGDHEPEGWVCCGEYNPETEQWSNQFDKEDIIYPSHWMPLPAKPIRY